MTDDLAKTTFLNQLRTFEQRSLLPIGYAFVLHKDSKSPVSLFSDLYRYQTQDLRLTVSIQFGRFDDGRYYIGVIMFDSEVGKYHQYKSFDLDQYIKEHSIQGFPSDGKPCLPNQDLELYCQQYFNALKVAFETYLKDQVTGVNFEEHDPFMGK